MNMENLSFRAWDKFYECMINPAGIELENGEVAHIIEQLPGETTKSSITYYELMQSTGLKDAHGTEIYEKDIVRDSYGDVFLIEWLDGSFVLTDFFSGGYDHCEIDDLESYEVIGNQFQHPHLLEE